MIEDERFFKKIFNGTSLLSLSHIYPMMILGDKDIFRFIFLLTGQQFYYVPYIPGFSLAVVSKPSKLSWNRFFREHMDSLFPLTSRSLRNEDIVNEVGMFSGRDCILHYFSSSNDYVTDKGFPLFFHQLKARDHESFTKYALLPSVAQNLPSGSVSENLSSHRVVH